MDEKRAEPHHGSEVTAVLLDLYNHSVPETYRVTDEAFDGLCEGGELFTRYDGGTLIGYALIRGSSLTLLCVDEAYRHGGIGSDLLNQAEEWARSYGKKRLTLGYGSDYVLQGVPAEKEDYRFFEKHGYTCTGYTYDMTVPLPVLKTADIPNSVTFALQCANDAVLEAVKNVEPAWLGVYENTDEDVILAKVNGNIAGFCLVSAWNRFSAGRRDVGSVSCVGVLPEYRKRGIGLAMVSEALGYLTEEGFARAELLHTSIPGWYGKLGFEPLHRLWMGEKTL